MPTLPALPKPSEIVRLRRPGAFVGDQQRQPVFGDFGSFFLVFAENAGKEGHVTCLRTGA